MIDYKKSKYANLFIIGSFAFSLLVGIVLITISGSFLNNGVENPLFLLGCFCYIIIHEVIHLIFMKTFSKENIHISFKFPTISVEPSFHIVEYYPHCENSYLVSSEKLLFQLRVSFGKPIHQ